MDVSGEQARVYTKYAEKHHERMPSQIVQKVNEIRQQRSVHTCERKASTLQSSPQNKQGAKSGIRASITIQPTTAAFNTI